MSQLREFEDFPAHQAIIDNLIEQTDRSFVPILAEMINGMFEKGEEHLRIIYSRYLTAADLAFKGLEAFNVLLQNKSTIGNQANLSRDIAAQAILKTDVMLAVHLSEFGIYIRRISLFDDIKCQLYALKIFNTIFDVFSDFFEFKDQLKNYYLPDYQKILANLYSSPSYSFQDKKT